MNEEREPSKVDDADVCRVVVNERFLETFGTGTLMGTIVKMRGSSFTRGMPKAVTLVFPETSLRWREKNGGPRLLVVTEYAVRLLVEDVLRLREMGVAVSSETTLEDPPEPKP